MFSLYLKGKKIIKILKLYSKTGFILDCFERNCKFYIDWNRQFLASVTFGYSVCSFLFFKKIL